MEGGAGKCTAIRSDQQVRMVKVRRYLRHLPQFDGLLEKVAGLVLKHLLAVIVIVFPRVEAANHGDPS